MGVNLAYFPPVICGISFILTVFFTRKAPLISSLISVFAILSSFILFIFILIDFLSPNLNSIDFSIDWIDVLDTRISWGILLDSLSVTMLGLITLVALLVQVYSISYMKGDSRFGWYFSVHSLFAAAMIAVVLVDNLLLMYFAWELVGLGSYLLIGFWYEKRAASEAAKKAFITTRIGDVALLIGIILIFKSTGTFNISSIFHIANNGGINENILTISTFLIFLGAMGKSAQFPFHVWLPDAMEGPTPVSALIHAATMVAAGVYLVARMMPLFSLAPYVLDFVVFIGLFTFIFGGTMAIVMHDIKRVLAYSTISHLGLMMLSLGFMGIASAIFHLIVHGVSKALLFLGAGSLMHEMEGETDIRNMGGLVNKMPITAITFIIGSVSLAGIIPLSGFFSKDEILLTVFEKGGILILFLTLIGAFLSSLYMFRLTFITFFGSLKSDNSKIGESPILMTLPLILLALLAIFMSALLLEISTFKGFIFFISGYKAHLNLLLIVFSSILSFVALILAWFIYIKDSKYLTDWFKLNMNCFYKLLLNKYYIDELYQYVINQIVLRFAQFIALFDRLVVNDIGVDKSSLSVKSLGLKLKFIQTGKMHGYAISMVIGFLILIFTWAIL
ncbi:MAG: NADH-quinone oxidoreductase subunit L [Chloroflexi bacterium]|nr:NADH-quinone oxidoreductase subunit L [Chloroflexota bacterium]|tara:strand:+ start:1297 stop:3150 length:1854 start_codon:yes stop_codon:yes gene_type:complete